MIVSAYKSFPPLPLEQSIQSLNEEATEPLTETKREAMTGDAQAQRKLELMADQSSSITSSIASSPSTIGGLLNVKA